MLQLLLGIVAFSLIAAPSLHFTRSGFLLGRRYWLSKYRKSYTLSRRRNNARIARLSSQVASQTIGSDSSIQWRVLEVDEVVDESVDCRSYYLVDPYGQKLPTFHPGQFVMVRPPMAGSYQTTRCYSLSSPPNMDRWRITVKRQADDPTTHFSHTKGGLSGWMHNRLHPGDCLLVGGPSGQFYLAQEVTSPIVLIAAGIGITPMACMLYWSLIHSLDRPVQLIYQARDPEHWPLGVELHQIANHFPHCHATTFFSRSTDEDLVELQQQVSGLLQSGRASIDDVIGTDHGNDTHYFICGPDDWMSGLRDSLIAEGISVERIHWESFGVSTNSEPTEPTRPGQYLVQFSRSELTVPSMDAEQSIWELAKANDISIASGCLSGVCGACRVRVKEGTICHSRKIAIDLPSNECLACVAHPSSDVVIEA